jgi:hypothetical protein
VPALHAAISKCGNICQTRRKLQDGYLLKQFPLCIYVREISIQSNAHCGRDWIRRPDLVTAASSITLFQHVQK